MEELLDNETAILVEMLTKHPVLLEKSNTPEMKSKKADALKEVCTSLTVLLGRPFDADRIKKKIANLKMRVKTKSDRNRTGNRPICLSKWERTLLDLLKAEENPTFTRLEGAVSAGIGESYEVPDFICQTPSSATPRPEKKRKKTLEGETDETKDLSNSELQRLVLLEQLSYIKLKKDLVAKKHRLVDETCKCTPEVTDDYTLQRL